MPTEMKCKVQDGRLLLKRASGEFTAMIDEDVEALEAWGWQCVDGGTKDAEYVIREVDDDRPEKRRNSNGRRWRLFSV